MNKPAPDWHAAASALRIDGRAFVGGQRVPTASGETFTKTSPIDGRVLGEIARGRTEDIDRAVGRRQLRYGANMVVLTVAFLGILVLLNWVVYGNSKR